MASFGSGVKREGGKIDMTLCKLAQGRRCSAPTMRKGRGALTNAKWAFSLWPRPSDVGRRGAAALAQGRAAAALELRASLLLQRMASTLRQKACRCQRGGRGPG